MEIQYDEIKADRRLWLDALGAPKVGWGSFLKSIAKKAWVRSPTSSMSRSLELARARGEQDHIVLGALANENPTLLDEIVLPKSSERFLQPDEWEQSKYYRPGLSFPDGVKEGVASIIADRKDEENTRRTAIERGPKGILPIGTMLATDLIVSALDPMNVAASFVPIVSQARYAGWLRRSAKTIARIKKGAIEGFAGALMIEPLVLSASNQEQADYGMSESLINIGLGPILGAGLHTGAGFISDVLSKSRPHTRSGALRAAVGELADDREVYIDPILKADDRIPNPGQYSDSLETESIYKDMPISEIVDPGDDLSLTGADLQTELDGLMENINLAVERDIISVEDIGSLRELDRALASVDDYKTAARALAMCLAR